MHFRQVEAKDLPASRYVRWAYSVGQYSADVTDLVGFTRLSGNRRRDLHGVANELVCSHDIGSVIPRDQAQSVLRGCIGPSEQQQVVLAFGSSLFPDSKSSARVASLYLTARSIAEQGGGLISTWSIGWVDLESGVCHKSTGGTGG